MEREKRAKARGSLTALSPSVLSVSLLIGHVRCEHAAGLGGEPPHPHPRNARIKGGGSGRNRCVSAERGGISWKLMCGRRTENPAGLCGSCVQRPGEQSCVQLNPLFCLVWFIPPHPRPRCLCCVCFINGEMDKRSLSGRNEFSFRSP